MIVNGMPMSNRVVIFESKNHLGSTIKLIHCSAGWEVAGSGTRPVPDCFKATWTMRDGTTGGTQYNDYETAEREYNRMMGY